MPITKVSKSEDEERLVYGVVLEPNVVDGHDEWEAEETIKEAAHGFMEGLNDGTGIGVQHETFGLALKVVESYLAPIDMMLGGQEIKKGSWVMAVRVMDDEIWESIKRGEFTGFSIGGTARVAGS